GRSGPQTTGILGQGRPGQDRQCVVGTVSVLEPAVSRRAERRLARGRGQHQKTPGPGGRRGVIFLFPFAIPVLSFEFVPCRATTCCNPFVRRSTSRLTTRMI